MKSFRDRNPYMIGIASVLVIATFVGLAFAVGVLHLLEHTYSARGQFSDASGVHSGDDVRVAGIKAGRVTKITPDRHKGMVLIDFEVKKGVNLGRNPTAEVALETLLGRKYLRLAGPVAKPYFGDLPKSQRIIPLDRTKTPFDLFELTKIGTRSVEATQTDKLNQLVGQLADITDDKQVQLHQLLDGVSSLSSAITDRDAQLRELLDRLDKLSTTLSDKDQTLVSLIDQSQGILGFLQQRRGDIQHQLESSNQLFTQLAGLVDVHKSQINAILDTLHPAIDVLDKNQQHIDTSLSWIGSGALGLAKSGSHGPWQDVYVRSVGPDVLGVLCDVLGGNKPCV